MKKRNPDLYVDVIVSCLLWDDLAFDPRPVAEKIIALTLQQAELPDEVHSAHALEVSVSLTGDEDIRQMNRRYRGLDKSTNVLSFAALEGEDMPISHPDTDVRHLGDLVMAFETLSREAAELEISFLDHYTHMLVHGTLHLLGYDHQEEEQARTMEKLEISILGALGIENPYSDEKYVA